MDNSLIFLKVRKRIEEGQLRAKERKDEVKGGIPDATSIFV